MMKLRLFLLMETGHLKLAGKKAKHIPVEE